MFARGRRLDLDDDPSGEAGQDGGSESYRIAFFDEGAPGPGSRVLLRHVPPRGTAKGKEATTSRGWTRTQSTEVRDAGVRMFFSTFHKGVEIPCAESSGR